MYFLKHPIICKVGNDIASYLHGGGGPRITRSKLGINMILGPGNSKRTRGLETCLFMRKSCNILYIRAGAGISFGIRIQENLSFAQSLAARLLIQLMLLFYPASSAALCGHRVGAVSGHTPGRCRGISALQAVYHHFQCHGKCRKDKFVLKSINRRGIINQSFELEERYP